MAEPDYEHGAPTASAPTDSTADAGSKGRPAPPSRPFQARDSSTPGTGGDAAGISEAYDLLARAVADLVDRHKRPTAAGVNSEMQRLSVGGFQHGRFQFETFRDFLSAAQRSGVVQLINPEPGSGQDMLVTLPGRPLPPPQRHPPRSGRIRPELWRAFTDWTPGWTRLWDVHRERPVAFPSDPRPLEPARYGLLRQQVSDTPERFRTISVIGEEEQVAWMHEFVEQLGEDDSTKQVLESALAQARPSRAFSAAIRTMPGVAQEWKRRRFERVHERIATWMDDNGVDVDIADSGVRRGERTRQWQREQDDEITVKRPERGRRILDAQNRKHEDALRQQILAILADMPLAELLRLPIPIEYTLDR